MFFNTLPEWQEDLHQVSLEMESILPKDWHQGAVGDIITDALSGHGKGYRPVLLLLAGKIGDRYSSCKQRLYRLSALVEFVHMASLIHDDIIDDSMLRRGQTTIQARYGKDAAVYAGDLLLGRVLTILLQDRLWESGALIAQTIQDMCRGEISQSAHRYDTDVSEDVYYTNIYGKTASMFVTVCKVGGIESGCAAETIERLGEIGLHLGYLFQIRDDLLDFSAAHTTDGKPSGMDFREGIFTLPVIHALSCPAYRTSLEKLAKSARERDLSASERGELYRILSESGGIAFTVKAAEGHRRKVESLLSELPYCESVERIRDLLSMLTLPDLPFGDGRKR